jgi:hypothetical protein
LTAHPSPYASSVVGDGSPLVVSAATLVTGIVTHAATEPIIIVQAMHHCTVRFIFIVEFLSD